MVSIDTCRIAYRPHPRSRPHSLKLTTTDRWKRLEHEITATRSICRRRISNCHTHSSSISCQLAFAALDLSRIVSGALVTTLTYRTAPRRNFHSICRGRKCTESSGLSWVPISLLQQTLVVRGERRSLSEHILRQLLKFPIGNQIDRET